MRDGTGYRVVRIPRHRLFLGTLSRLVPDHTFQALVEIDVTRGHTLIAQHQERTGERLSFTGWIIACIARAVDEHREVQAYRKGRQLVLFDDVDVGFTIDRGGQGEWGVAGFIVRGANRKSFREIHDEIRAAQREPATHGSVVGENESARTVGRIQRLPGPLLRVLVAWYGRNPFFRKRVQGTVGVTSLGGSAERLLGVPLANGPCPLFFAVGLVTRKPGLVGNRVEPREYLPMCVTFDHDAVDGMAAARFLSRLGGILEEGYGLDSPA
jgi:pyruvate/2-oxoglutarate dehydrogenase complex dihydrolipoamide acyltransferase (E2) component